jgi:hypothetical protein
MSISIVDGSRLPKFQSCFWLPRLLVPVMFLVAACSTQAPMLAQAPADDGEDLLLLAADELPAAAAECGIGIAGERVEPAAAAAQAFPTMALGKWVAGLIISHAKSVATRELGLDDQYNRFLAMSRQLRQIEDQLRALDEKFDQLGDQIRAKELRQLSTTLAGRFVDPVKNGMHGFLALNCDEAALRAAERSGGNVGRARVDRNRSLNAFRGICAGTPRFQDIPNDLTNHFKSGESILDRYLDAVIVPRRYLVTQDARDLEDFFYRYHLIQVQALRLHAECELRFPGPGVDPNDPGLRDSVADSVYRRPNSHFERAKMSRLPKIVPELLPDNIVFDNETGLLWWNGLDYGAHPFVNPHWLIYDVTIRLNRDIPGPKGTWRFELARLDEVEKLAALDAAMPLARRDRSETGRYPKTLKPFLSLIGLGRVTERIPDSGHLGYVWTSDAGVSIKRCHTLESRECRKFYSEELGRNAGTAPANGPTLRAASGHIFFAPIQCRPNECFGFWHVNSRVVALCQDRRRRDDDPRGRCIPDLVLGQWQAPGIYRAVQRKDDRFFAFDLAPLQ